MMKTVYSLVVLLAAAPSWGGVRIKFDDVDPRTNQTKQREVLLDSDRLRTNVDQNSSVLFLTDGGRNRIVMLDSSRNEYREMDQETMNQISQQMRGVFAQLQNLPPEQRAKIEEMMRGRGLPGAPAKAAEVTYTAEGSGSVNGFPCTKYQGMRGAEKVAELCAVKPPICISLPPIFKSSIKCGSSLPAFLPT